MVPHLVGLFAATVIGYSIHWLLGDHLGLMAECLLNAVFGGGAYIYSVYKLKKMHGDF